MILLFVAIVVKNMISVTKQVERPQMLCIMPLINKSKCLSNIVVSVHFLNCSMIMVSKREHNCNYAVILSWYWPYLNSICNEKFYSAWEQRRMERINIAYSRFTTRILFVGLRRNAPFSSSRILQIPGKKYYDTVQQFPALTDTLWIFWQQEHQPNTHW